MIFPAALLWPCYSGVPYLNPLIAELFLGQDCCIQASLSPRLCSLANLIQTHMVFKLVYSVASKVMVHHCIGLTRLLNQKAENPQPTSSCAADQTICNGLELFLCFYKKNFSNFQDNLPCIFFLVMDLENSQLNHKCTKRHSTTKMGIRKHFHESSMSKKNIQVCTLKFGINRGDIFVV